MTYPLICMHMLSYPVPVPYLVLPRCYAWQPWVHDQIDISDKADVNSQDNCENGVSKLSQDNSFLVPFRVLSNIAALYPNLFVLNKIVLSLPAPNCSAERAVSHLKLVKTRLRSSMSNSWLKSLMIMSTEKDTVSELNVDSVIDRFARSSSQFDTISTCVIYT